MFNVTLVLNGSSNSNCFNILFLMQVASQTKSLCTVKTKQNKKTKQGDIRTLQLWSYLKLPVPSGTTNESEPSCDLKLHIAYGFLLGVLLLLKLLKVKSDQKNKHAKMPLAVSSLFLISSSDLCLFGAQTVMKNTDLCHMRRENFFFFFYKKVEENNKLLNVNI